MNVDTIFEKLKTCPTKYDEEIHPKMILRLMLEKCRLSAFCCEALVSNQTVYNWCAKYPLFALCFMMGKEFARENWEKEGERIRDRELPIGVVDYAFEHWKMMGWSRFGISKNSRIKLSLDPDASPLVHYGQLLKQASEGDFTASEIKQLMEAINVGINVHQTFELQKQIDELKSNQETMATNANGHNSSTNTRIAQKD